MQKVKSNLINQVLALKTKGIIKLDQFSTWFVDSEKVDLLGVAMIAITSLFAGYLFETLGAVSNVHGFWKLVPFGLISMLDGFLSVLSTRLNSRFNNLGNKISIPEVIIGCWIDTLLGNKGAIYTYSVSLVIILITTYVWKHKEKYEQTKILNKLKGKIVFISLSILIIIASFSLNYLGYAQTLSQNLVMYLLSSTVFALSFIANMLNAIKTGYSWYVWLFYSIVQLIKAIIQHNFSNIGKNIYYIVQDIASIRYWLYIKVDEVNNKIANKVSKGIKKG